MDRNNEIQRSIEQSRVPILPFELTLAKNALKVHVEKQSDLSAKMRDAMNQSSETWHDNAPAEVIANDSRNLAKIAEKTINILGNADVFDYEANPEEGVTLGSLVDVRYGNSPDVTSLVLTGVSRELTPDLAENINNDKKVNVVTLSSPIGKAIFGKSIGQKASFTVGGESTITLTIESIKQISTVSTENTEN